ncbi:3-hydroxyacyl-CoA dehydrogenase NAD-binding domain-containing protein [Streptomyces sp. NPDC001107]
MTAIHRAGIVGCGTMGSGIAHICAAVGLDRAQTARHRSAPAGRALASMNSSKELGRFLKARRAELSPSTVGLSELLTPASSRGHNAWPPG